MSRTALAGLAGILAAVLLPLSLLSVWVNGVVSDTDTYVDTVTPLADDEVVRAAAVDEIERATVELLESAGTAPPGVGLLVHAVVERVVASPVFRTAWIAANRIAHDQVIAVLEGRREVTLDDQGRVTIELGGVYSAVAQALAVQGVVGADQIADLDPSIPIMDADQLGRARRAYQALDALGFWLPFAWLVAVLLTLVLARRKVAVAAKLAIASLVALGVMALGLVVARSTLTQDLPHRGAARQVSDVVTASLWRQLELVAVVLAVVALTAALVAALRDRRGAPSGSPDAVPSSA
jgi:hypothetical protein